MYLMEKECIRKYSQQTNWDRLMVFRGGKKVAF